jgi:hypothetical protein
VRALRREETWQRHPSPALIWINSRAESISPATRPDQGLCNRGAVAEGRLCSPSVSLLTIPRGQVAYSSPRDKSELAGQLRPHVPARRFLSPAYPLRRSRIENRHKKGWRPLVIALRVARVWNQENAPRWSRARQGRA